MNVSKVQWHNFNEKIFVNPELYNQKQIQLLALYKVFPDQCFIFVLIEYCLFFTKLSWRENDNHSFTYQKMKIKMLFTKHTIALYEKETEIISHFCCAKSDSKLNYLKTIFSSFSLYLLFPQNEFHSSQVPNELRA
jgi:hypothetical protein